MDTSKIVGEKIKSLRENKNISREELAERSGLAIEQVERIENNIDLPSLAPLIKIARVLGVRLGTFLDDQDETGPAICRKSEATDSISFSNNAIQSRKHMEYHSLSKAKADRHMEPFIIDVAPTDDNEFVLSSHEGEEFIFVLEGIMDQFHGSRFVTFLRNGIAVFQRFNQIVAVLALNLLDVTHGGQRVASAPEFDGVDYQNVGKIANTVYWDNIECQEYQFVYKLVTNTLIPAYQFAVQSERSDARTEHESTANHNGRSHFKIKLFHNLPLFLK